MALQINAIKLFDDFIGRQLYLQVLEIIKRQAACKAAYAGGGANSPVSVDTVGLNQDLELLIEKLLTSVEAYFRHPEDARNMAVLANTAIDGIFSRIQAITEKRLREPLRDAGNDILWIKYPGSLNKQGEQITLGYVGKFRDSKNRFIAEFDRGQYSAREDGVASSVVVIPGQLSAVESLILRILEKESQGLMQKIFPSERRVARKAAEEILGMGPARETLVVDASRYVSEIEEGMRKPDALSEIIMLTHAYLKFLLERRGFLIRGSAALLPLLASPSQASAERLIAEFFPPILPGAMNPLAQVHWQRGQYDLALACEIWTRGRDRYYSSVFSGQDGLLDFVRQGELADLTRIGGQVSRHEVGGLTLYSRAVKESNIFGLGMSPSSIEEQIITFAQQEAGWMGRIPGDSLVHGAAQHMKELVMSLEEKGLGEQAEEWRRRLKGNPLAEELPVDEHPVVAQEQPVSSVRDTSADAEGQDVLSLVHEYLRIQEIILEAFEQGIERVVLMVDARPQVAEAKFGAWIKRQGIAGIVSDDIQVVAWDECMLSGDNDGHLLIILKGNPFTGRIVVVEGVVWAKQPEEAAPTTFLNLVDDDVMKDTRVVYVTVGKTEDGVKARIDLTGTYRHVEFNIKDEALEQGDGAASPAEGIQPLDSSSLPFIRMTEPDSLSAAMARQREKAEVYRAFVAAKPPAERVYWEWPGGEIYRRVAPSLRFRYKQVSPLAISSRFNSNVFLPLNGYRVYEVVKNWMIRIDLEPEDIVATYDCFYCLGLVIFGRKPDGRPTMLAAHAVPKDIGGALRTYPAELRSEGIRDLAVVASYNPHPLSDMTDMRDDARGAFEQIREKGDHLYILSRQGCFNKAMLVAGIEGVSHFVFEDGDEDILLADRSYAQAVLRDEITF